MQLSLFIFVQALVGLARVAISRVDSTFLCRRGMMAKYDGQEELAEHVAIVTIFMHQHICVWIVERGVETKPVW